MYLFGVIFLIVAACAVADSYLNRNLFIYISLILLMVIAGLRNINTGFDTYNYYCDYNNIAAGFSPISSKEQGFVLLEKIFSVLNLPFQYFLIFIAGLTMFCIIYGYSKLTPYPGFALLYYYSRFYINRDLNQIRASLAAAILLFSIQYVFKKKPLKFLIIILLATFIHTGAVIALLIYPLYMLFMKFSDMKFSDREKLIGYCSTIIVSGLASYVVSPYIARLDEQKIAAYTQSKMYITGNGLLNPVILLQVIISILALYAFLKKGEESSNHFFSATLCTYMISTVLLILLSQYYTLAGRTSTFLATVEPVVVIYLLQSVFKRTTVKFLMIVVCLIIFLMIDIYSGLIPQINYSFSIW